VAEEEPMAALDLLMREVGEQPRVLPGLTKLAMVEERAQV
jgi:hypothetical protein